MRYTETSNGGQLLHPQRQLKQCRHSHLKRASHGGTKTAAAAAAKSLQSCPTLCDPIDSSPPGSPVPARDVKSKEGKNIPMFLIFTL